MSDPMIDAAERAAKQGAWREAAAQLATAWEQTRAPELADAVAVLDARSRERPDPPVLAEPWPAAATAARKRVDVLLAHRPSPRISHALVSVLTRRLYDTRAGEQVARRIVAGLLAQRDPAVTRYLAAHGTPRAMGALLGKPRPEVPALAPDDAAALARITALATPDTRGAETLLAAVYASPTEDGPREVLADALAGDPRGEFIALQLADHRGAGTDKTRARARALLRAAGTTWLGGIRDEVEPYYLQYARGFPAVVSLMGETPPFAAPGWATVEELELIRSELTVAPQLRGLRRLIKVPAESVGAIDLPNPALLEELVIVGDPAPLAKVRTPLRPTRLGFAYTEPIRVYYAARDLARWPIAKRVTALRIDDASLENLGIAHSCLSVGPALASVYLTGERAIRSGVPHWSAWCSRDALRLRWIPGEPRHHVKPDALEALDDFAPPPSVKELVVEIAGPVPDELARRARAWEVSLVSQLSHAKSWE